VLILVRIAAGDEEATREAAESAGRPRYVVREAAAFFIEQVLLHPGADSYRVLGARPEAPYGELRRNMALLSSGCILIVSPKVSWRFLLRG
jgi:hypothetical protein